jgi:hypothetical protein
MPLGLGTDGHTQVSARRVSRTNALNACLGLQLEARRRIVSVDYVTQ